MEYKANNNNADVNVPKMRTIRETARETGFPENAIRQLVRENKIIYVRCASRVLINIDRFIDYLNGKHYNCSPDTPDNDKGGAGA